LWHSLSVISRKTGKPRIPHLRPLTSCTSFLYAVIQNTQVLATTRPMEIDPPVGQNSPTSASSDSCPTYVSIPLGRPNPGLEVCRQPHFSISPTSCFGRTGSNPRTSETLLLHWRKPERFKMFPHRCTVRHKSESSEFTRASPLRSCFRSRIDRPTLPNRAGNPSLDRRASKLAVVISTDPL